MTLRPALLLHADVPPGLAPRETAQREISHLAHRCAGALGLLLLAALVPAPVLAQDASDAGAAAAPTDERAELRTLIETGRYEEVAEWYLEEPDAYPLLWARYLRETGRGDEALALIEGTPGFAAEEPDVLVAAAAIHQERGRLERAKELLRTAVRVDGSHVEGRTRLGDVFVRQGLRQDARDQYRQVLAVYQGMTAAQVKESRPETFVWMAQACLGLERVEEAYTVLLSTAFDIDPESVAAHTASGWLMHSKYNYPDARSHFEDALARNSNHADAHVGMARSIYSDFSYPGARFAEAKSHLEQADAVWKDHPEVLMLRGDMAFYDEEWEIAEESYRNAIDQDPTDLWRKGRLAALYFAVGRLEEFEELAAAVEEGHPAPAPFYGSLAERLVDRFFYVEAADFAKKAIELDPDYRPAYVVLGINALRAGRDEEGREYTRKAFEADPYNVWAYNTLQLIKRIDRKFIEKKNDDFVIRMPQEEAPFLMPYLEPLLYETRARMEKEYQQAVHRPITVEDFAQHAYFSARSIGLPGLAASGVCFGRMVTLTTPNAIPGNWGVVAVHEFAHVVTLHKAAHRIPRWFGEGLSVFEEGRNVERWARHYADEWVTAVHAGHVLPMEDIQEGFTRPSFPGQILLSYYQGGLLCTYIEEKWSYDHLLQMLDAYRGGKNTEQVFRAVLETSLPEFDRGFLEWGRTLAESFRLGPVWPEASIQRLRYHTEDHPDDAQGFANLGFAYFFNGRKADAELALGKAKEKDADLGDVAALEGMMAFRGEKKRTARERLGAALEAGTTYAYRSTLALALLALDSEDDARAEELLRAAIAMHPQGVRPRFGKPSAYLLLAALLDDLGREEEAVETLEALVRYDRDDFGTRKRLAEYHASKEAWEKVVEAAWDAPFINPYDAGVHRLLAQAYFEIEAYRRAAREYEVWMNGEMAPLGEILPRLAYCHWKLGDHEKARELAERARTIVPDDPLVVEVLEGLGEVR